MRIAPELWAQLICQLLRHSHEKHGPREWPRYLAVETVFCLRAGVARVTREVQDHFTLQRGTWNLW